MKKSIVVLLHILYWFRLPPFLFTLTTADFYFSGSFIFYNVLPTVTQFTAFYIAYFFLFSRFLAKKKIWQFIIAALLILFFSYAFGWSIFLVLKAQFSFPGFPAELSSINRLSFLLFFGAATSGLFSGCLLKAFVSWYADIRVKEDLKQKTIMTELALLKAQVNPHFLFNTLNNIDAMIESNPAVASHYLNELSDILRFTLYESSGNKIPLLKEFEYIQKYVGLQSIRTNNSSFALFNVHGEPNGLEIAPLIFMPFIENAFKYSTNKKVDKAIEINFIIKQNNLTFNCVNTISIQPSLSLSPGGLGIENIKGRLALLYPNHILDIKMEDNHYIVSLQIDLNEY